MQQQAEKRPWPWLDITCYLMAFVCLGWVAYDLIRPRPFHCHPRSKTQIVKSEVRALGAALSEYAIRNGGRYPLDLDWLCRKGPNGDGYLNCQTVPLDPWGRAYVYELPANRYAPFTLKSFGADGLPGGCGEDRDVLYE